MKDAKREIIGLALLLEDISDLGVSVEYSAHVKVLYIYVTETKEDYKNKIFKGEFYTDFRYERQKEKYLEIKSYLQSKISEYTVI